ncbi:MAG TPA: DUF1361 domain-containing protein [Ferruginibacter sp.]|nr:DUF1361 domain-containing protein [Ferruginibacter sp.]HMP19915.1 DUF1361 domain-containing protein [Ferruginibacter sp.]
MARLSLFKRITALFILFLAVLIFARIGYTGSKKYIFLLWNIFLAWIPFGLSLYIHKCRIFKSWKTLSVLACWLLFFPNALYVVTDLIHLQEEASVPAWYDAILLFTASILGLLYAFASLYKIEQFLNRHLKSSVVTGQLTLFFIFAGSFGVYLGRFDRWNSWDIVTYPHHLLRDIANYCTAPVHHYRIWLITLIFTAFFSLMYYAIKQLPGLMHEKRSFKNQAQG